MSRLPVTCSRRVACRVVARQPHVFTQAGPVVLRHRCPSLPVSTLRRPAPDGRQASFDPLPFARRTRPRVRKVIRRLSACPACWLVSAIRCRSTRRAYQLAPGSNHGALRQRVRGVEVGQGRDELVGPARDLLVARRQPGQRLAVVHAEAPRPVPAVVGGRVERRRPSTMNRAHRRSVIDTCLIRPPRHNSLAVGRTASCSSVNPRTVCRRKYRCLLTSPAGRPARRSPSAPSWSSHHLSRSVAPDARGRDRQNREGRRGVSRTARGTSPCAPPATRRVGSRTAPARRARPRRRPPRCACAGSGAPYTCR